MLDELEKISKCIGNTPLISLINKDAYLYAKLEYNNFSGSSKDRAGYSILSNAIREGKITTQTVVIASSSGNLAISVGMLCRSIGIKFIPVIDPNINKDYETLLNLISYRVVKVTKPDNTGGYLLTRIETVTKMCSEIKNSFCADQYTDPNNYRGYFSLGNEILQSLPKVDFIFVPVSSSGAITGISISIKKHLPGCNIIAVDVKGSVIFGQSPEKRYISGIGSSQASPIIKDAIIDDVIHVSQPDIVNGCYELLDEQVVFAGASSGAVYSAAKRYLHDLSSKTKPSALLVFPDRGNAYLDTIYNKIWVKTNLYLAPVTL
jgi:2,3-diaminopropionate biosynthesis protein SbnA